MTPIYPGRFSKSASLPRFPKGGARSIPRQPIERATKEKNKVHEYKGNRDTEIYLSKMHLRPLVREQNPNPESVRMGVVTTGSDLGF